MPLHDLVGLIEVQLLQTSLLFVCVLVLTRLFAKRRPHLGHLLWLLFLVKCVTPPIFSSSVGVFGYVFSSAAAESSAITTGDPLHDTSSDPFVANSGIENESEPIAIEVQQPLMTDSLELEATPVAQSLLLPTPTGDSDERRPLESEATVDLYVDRGGDHHRDDSCGPMACVHPNTWS